MYIPHNYIRKYVHTCTYILHSYIVACSSGGKSLEKVIAQTGIQKILLIHMEWLDKILHHGKRVELRSKPARIRGPIGLGWRGKLYGTTTLRDCFPVSSEWKEQNIQLHQVGIDNPLLSKYDWAWLLGEVQILTPPVDFVQPLGAMVWVSPAKKIPPEAEPEPGYMTLLKPYCIGSGHIQAYICTYIL